MPETLTKAEPAQDTSYQETMAVARSGFEYNRQVAMERTRSQIERRLNILHGDEPSTSSSEFEYQYDPSEYDTTRFWTDIHGESQPRILTVPEYLAEAGDNDWDYPVKHDIYAGIAASYFETINNHDAWWQQADLVLGGSRFKQEFFQRNQPTEQLVVGDGRNGVRFFNYGPPMSDQNVEDCRQFIDLVTQYFGDAAYSVLQDVVIAPFDPGVDGTRGFVIQGVLKGVEFIHSDLLADVSTSNNSRYSATELLKVFVHEFGHLMHGSDEVAREQMEEFARKVGWDIDALNDQIDNWTTATSDLSEYGPQLDYAVIEEDGSRRDMDVDEFAGTYPSVDGSYQDLELPANYYHLGSPSDYGRSKPNETSAETSAFSMLGNFVAKHMPETRDAWLEHMQQRLERNSNSGALNIDGYYAPPVAIATSLTRKPICAEKRTGKDILYPTAVGPIPDKINVRLSEVAS